jgi:hypothetical protein
MVAVPEQRDLRIYYGQQGYQDAWSNGVVVLVCESEAEFRLTMVELVRRGSGHDEGEYRQVLDTMLGLNVAEGQHRTDAIRPGVRRLGLVRGPLPDSCWWTRPSPAPLKPAGMGRGPRFRDFWRSPAVRRVRPSE